MTLDEQYTFWTNKLGKWRNVFASWQLGTRDKQDGEVRAVKDAVERSLIMRAEISALSQLLVTKGVFTAEEFMAQIIIECQELDTQLEKFFPSFTTAMHGVDIDLPVAVQTMRKKGFPK